MAFADGGIRVAKTSPSFLHANSTSHTWVFSAFAEIIDNSLDAKATELYIDHRVIGDSSSIVFTDNGCGLDVERLHHMLSFGYCEKDVNKPVGLYGNGFKSGSMRLGKDALVFSKHLDTLHIGFLSQSYLNAIQSDTVLVPIVSFDKRTYDLLEESASAKNLEALTTYSLFNTTEDLLAEFDSLRAYPTGTKIIIYNLNRDSNGRLELDFDSNQTDIINSESMELDYATSTRPVREYQPAYKTSLREYCAILFLKPRMKIYLRQLKVATKLVTRSLRKTEKDVYRPLWLDKAVQIIFGFGSDKECGLMMYHRNRLIKGYERVGAQKQGNGGQGVVGVVEVNFLTPVHNKQDFNKNDRYNACINSLGIKLMDYYIEKTDGGCAATNEHSEKSNQAPDWTWAQCDNCLKWRRLPEGMTDENLPDKWFCYMNLDQTHNRCDVEEEMEDEDDVRKATYEKTHKRKIEEEKQRKRINLVQRERALHARERELEQARRISLEAKNEESRKLQAAQRQLQAAIRKERAQEALITLLIKDQARGQQPDNRNVTAVNPVKEELSDNEGPPPKVQRTETPVHHDVITIDSDDGDDDSDDTVDVKPVINDMKIEMIDNEVTSSDSVLGNQVSDLPMNTTQEFILLENKVSVDSPCTLHSSTTSNKSIQTDDYKCKCGQDVKKVKSDLESCQKQLRSLRKNVTLLLSSVQPDLKLRSLETVDDIVLEMIRINNSSTVKQETSEENVLDEDTVAIDSD